MGQHAEDAYEGGFYTGNEGGRGKPRPQPKPGKGCPRCPLRFPTGKERRKHLRDAHGLKFDTKRIGCLIPIKEPT